MVPHPDTTPLIRKLEQIMNLSESEKRSVLALPFVIKDFEPDQDIVQEGARPTECALILRGFACRYKMLPNGKRQILSFHLPGDIPDLQSLHLKVMDHTLATLAVSKIAIVQHDSVLQLIDENPRIGRLFWRDALVDAAVFREWIVTVGRRPALERTAHLLCELLVRFKFVGLASDNSFQLSLTQSELSDALGLSLIQVNRSIQTLRREGLIQLRAGTLTVLDKEGLQKLASFDPTYLYC